MTAKDSKDRKSTIQVKKQPALSKDQEQLLQYYIALSPKDRKDALKFMKMISGNVKNKK